MNDKIKEIEERLAKRKSYFDHARDPIAEADMDTLLEEVKRRGELVEHYQNQSKLNHEGHLEFIALSSNLQQRVDELEETVQSHEETIKFASERMEELEGALSRKTLQLEEAEGGAGEMLIAIADELDDKESVVCAIPWHLEDQFGAMWDAGKRAIEKRRAKRKQNQAALKEEDE